MAKRQLNYDIKFNTDTSGLEQAQTMLKEIRNLSGQYIKMNGLDVTREELTRVQATAAQVSVALEQCFNPKLNTFNFTQFNSVLNATGLTVEKVEKDFSLLGEQGQKAFRNITESLYTTNATLNKSKNLITQAFETLTNAAKWSVAYGIINNISNGIKSAWSYAVSLDSALNDIRIVTGKSYEEMEKFARSANKTAKALGTSTMDYTKGSLIYYQQGLSDKEVAARTAVTAKAANVTGQTVQEVSEQLTAVWNGFNVAAANTEEYVDRLAAVAAASASDLEELSIAMSRVASAASTMGINIDQLTAQIATIESVTRQDAASIGTSLKTIYSRMGDLALGAEDEFGVTLGDVSGKMKQMGIDILDQSGNMRDMGMVIEEVAAKWDTWTSAQQQAAAVAIAGKRQYNNLFALFENWDMYEANKSVSENSLGELQKQQDTYMESTAAHLEQLSTAAEKLKNTFFENKGMNALIDALTWIKGFLADILEAAGGGANLILGTLGPALTLFSKNIGKSISGLVDSLQSGKKAIQEIEARASVVSRFGGSSFDEAIKEMTKIEKQRMEYVNYLTDADNERYNALIKQKKELVEQKEELDSIKKVTKDILSSASDESFLKKIQGRDEKGRLTGNLEINSFKDLEKLSDKDKAQVAAAAEKELERSRKVKGDANYYLSKIGKYNPLIDDKDSKNLKDANALSKEQIKLVEKQLSLGALNEKQQKKLSSALENFNKTQEKGAEIDLSRNNAQERMKELCNALAESYGFSEENLKSLIRAVTDYTAAQQANTEANKQNADSLDALGKKGKIAVIIDTISSVVGTVTTLNNAIVTLGNSIQNVMDVLSDDTLSVGEKIQKVIATIVAVITTSIFTIISLVKLFKVALIKEAGEIKSKVTKVLGWIGAILAVVSTVATIIGTIVSFIDFRSEAEKAAAAVEEEKKKLEELQSTLASTKQSYQDLYDTIEDYKTARNSIEDLKAGTAEWAQAIQDANEKALALIATNSEFAKYATYDKNGLIRFSNTDLDNILNSKERQIALTQSRVYAQQVSVNNAKSNSNKVQWTSSILAKNGKSTDIYDEALKGYHANGEAYFASNTFKTLINKLGYSGKQLDKMVDSLQDNIRATEANTKANIILQRSSTKKFLEGQGSSNYSASKNKDAYANFLNKKSQSDEFKSAEGKTTTWDKYILSHDNGKYKEDLAKALGVDPSELSVENNTIKWNGGQISDTDAEKLVKDYRRKQAAESKYGERFKDFINNVNEVQANLLDMSSGEPASFENLTYDQLSGDAAIYGIKDEQKLFFADSIEEFNELYKKSKALTEEEFKLAKEKISKVIGDNGAAAKTMTETLTAQEAKAIGNAYQKVSTTMSSEMLNTFKKYMGTGNLNDEQVTAAKILNEIDVTSETAVGEFIVKMKEAGFTIDANSAKWKGVIGGIESSNTLLSRSVDSLDDIANKIQEIRTLSQDLKIGSIVSEEDYKTILKYYPVAKDLFIRTAEGYQMIADTANGLQKDILSPYSDLKRTKTYYANMRDVGKVTDNNNQTITDFEINSSTIDDTSLLSQMSNVNSIISQLSDEQKKDLFNGSPINEQTYKSIMEGVTEKDGKKVFGSEQDKTNAQKFLSHVSDIQNKLQNNLYTEDAAVTLHFTSTVGSLTDVEKAYANNELTSEQYAKVRTSWISKYTDELGVSLDVYEKFKKSFFKDDASALKAISQLNSLDDELDRIQKKSENLKGEALAESLDLQNEKITFGVQNLNKLIQSGVKSLNLEGLSYDEILDKYNTDFNTLTDEQKAEYKNLFEYMEKVLDYEKQMRENAVTAIDAKVQVELDTAQVKKDWDEFKRNYMKVNNKGNVVFKSVIEISQDISLDDRLESVKKSTESFVEEFNSYEKGIAEQLALGTTEGQQKAEEYRKSQLQLLEDQMNNLKELYQIWTDGWDELINKTEDFAVALDSINGLYKNLIEINKVLDKDGTQSQLLYSNIISNQREIIKAYAEQVTNAQRELSEAQSMNDEKMIETAKNNVQSAASSLAEAGLNLVDLIKERAAAQLEDLFETYNTLSQEWDRTKTLDDRLLNQADSNLNRNKIRRQFQTAIDNADSLAAQEKIKKAMEEQLLILEEKDRLSQYEVDRANAVYELTLKQIALEESQRNANKMKLVRDANGNLTYSFVQDADAASKAKEELETVQNNLFNIDNNQARDQIDKYYQYITEAQQALQEAQESGDEERYSQVNEYYFGSNGLITKLKEEMGMVISNLQGSSLENGIVATTLKNYEAAMEIYKSDLSTLLDGVKENHNTYTEDMKNASTIIKDASTSIEKAVKDLSDKNGNFVGLKTEIDGLNTTLGSVKITMETMNKSLDKVSGAFSSLLGFIEYMENYTPATGQYEKDDEALVEKAKANTDGGDNIKRGWKPGVNNTYVTMFDTGGYTGEFGSEGKLAVLHQKELVLNADDTQNILAAVSMIRSLDETFSGLGTSLAAQSAVPALRPSLGKMSQGSESIDQNVKIEASFPNVTDRYEIQEAINNLVNLASQKAFENNF